MQKMAPINGQKLAIAGATTIVAEPALALAHGGGVGVIVGLAAGALAYLIADEIEQSKGGEGKPSSPASVSGSLKTKDPGQPSLLYRVLNGKSVRESNDDTSNNDSGEPTTKSEQQQKDQNGAWIPPQFKLDDALDIVHEFNKKGYVYFGDSENGAVAIALNAMYHVIDVSSSGKGKSNRFRLGMMQMVNTCETYYINPFAANVKAVTDEREIEVWKPIFDRLANKRPIKDGAEIQELMTALVEEIERRNEQEEDGDFSWQQHPIFVFIDELPEVSARCPDAIKLLDKIGRGGRQFCIFCWVSSQTALTSEIGQSTAAQANYKTRIYGGGDKTSSNRLMKGSVPKDTERILQSNGAGLTLMLADGMEELSFVRAPLVTNEALFSYLGLPAFHKEDWIGSKVKGVPVKQNLLRDLSPDLSQPLSQNLSRSEKEPIQAQQGHFEPVKGERRESVKGPNRDVILEAMDELQAEGKALTMNAIARKANLTWRQHDEIEEIASYYGYILSRGTGRPSKEA